MRPIQSQMKCQASQMPPHYMQGNTNQSNATPHPGHVPSPQMGSPQHPTPSPNPGGKTVMSDAAPEVAEENGPPMTNGIDTPSQKDEESSDSSSHFQTKQVRVELCCPFRVAVCRSV